MTNNVYNKTRESWLKVGKQINELNKIGKEKKQTTFFDALVEGYNNAIEKYDLPFLDFNNNEP